MDTVLTPGISRSAECPLQSHHSAAPYRRRLDALEAGLWPYTTSSHFVEVGQRNPILQWLTAQVSLYLVDSHFTQSCPL